MISLEAFDYRFSIPVPKDAVAKHKDRFSIKMSQKINKLKQCCKEELCNSFNELQETSCGGSAAAKEDLHEPREISYFFTTV